MKGFDSMLFTSSAHPPLMAIPTSRDASSKGQCRRKTNGPVQKVRLLSLSLRKTANHAERWERQSHVSRSRVLESHKRPRAPLPTAASART